MTTTDPEYDRLRDAVVEAAEKLFEAERKLLSATNFPSGSAAKSEVERAGIELDKATSDLIDYRTKSTPPDLVPLRVEPPEGTKGDTFHWLADEDRIEPFCWTLTGRWQGIGRSGNWTAETVADDGWRYHSAASTCQPDTRIEVSDDASTRKAAIFSEPSGPTLVRNPAYYSPTQPAPVQQAEADEDERKWLVWYHDPDMPPELIVRGGNAEECARKRHADQLNAWSCHLFREVFPGEPATPTITKDQWEEIYSLAKTRAPEQFRTEAKALLGGGV